MLFCLGMFNSHTVAFQGGSFSNKIIDNNVSSSKVNVLCSLVYFFVNLGYAVD